MKSAFHSFFQRARQQLKTLGEGRRDTSCGIIHDTTGLTAPWLMTGNGSREYLIEWNNVIQVLGFKKDCFAFDLICLEFELKDKTVLEIDEEMSCWNELVEKLPDYLPGCKSFAEWWEVVALPAFELNLTILFQRDPSIENNLMNI